MGTVSQPPRAAILQRFSGVCPVRRLGRSPVNRLHCRTWQGHWCLCVLGYHRGGGTAPRFKLTGKLGQLDRAMRPKHLFSLIYSLRSPSCLLAELTVRLFGLSRSTRLRRPIKLTDLSLALEPGVLNHTEPESCQSFPHFSWHFWSPRTPPGRIAQLRESTASSCGPTRGRVRPR